jgi:DNA-binding MarR family transcriptional regulator
MRNHASDPEALRQLDDVLHVKSRLGIMTILATQGGADFPTLKRELGLTDGNLGTHIRVLEEAGYIEVDKSFVARKPRTTCRPTRRGRAAFERYLDQLEAVIRSARRKNPR